MMYDAMMIQLDVAAHLTLTEIVFCSRSIFVAAEHLHDIFERFLSSDAF